MYTMLGRSVDSVCRKDYVLSISLPLFVCAEHQHHHHTTFFDEMRERMMVMRVSYDDGNTMMVELVVVAHGGDNAVDAAWKGIFVL